MEEAIPKWGVSLDDTFRAFLLGVNINIGKYNQHWYGYICIYLGFKTLVIGKDIFPEKDKLEE